MASSHNRGFILPTVKRRLVVKVRLHSLLSLLSYDDPQCKPPTCSLCTCSPAKVLLFLWNYNTSSARSARNILWRVSHIFKMCFTSSSSFSASLLPFSLSSLKAHVHVTSTESTPQSSPYPRDIRAMGWPDGGCRLGAYACAHFLCAPPLPSVRMSSVKVEHRKREIKHYALYCKRLLCIPVHFNYWNGTCIVDISCSLRRCFPVSSTHFRAQRFTAAMLSAVLGSYPSCFVLGPYLSRWLTVGRELRPYLCDLGDKQTHCISNIRHALEHRSESGDARDTVQPQTVWVICLLVKPDRSNGEHTTGREAHSALSD